MRKTARERSVLMATSKAASQPAGTLKIKLQVKRELHETMKRIREIRHQMEGSDVKLGRVYGEAMDQYVNAKPQQKLLKEWGNGNSRTGKASGD
jgi:hypothetical protein